MSGLTGVELSQSILKIHADIPIVLVTGYSSKVSLEKARTMGIAAFVQKPLTRKGLAEVVHNTLEKNR